MTSRGSRVLGQPHKLASPGATPGPAPFRIEYDIPGGRRYQTVVEAHNREEAMEQFRQDNPTVELVSCDLDPRQSPGALFGCAPHPQEPAARAVDSRAPAPSVAAGSPLSRSPAAAMDGPAGDLVEDCVKLMRWFNRVPSISKELIEGMCLNFDIQALCRLGVLKPAGHEVTGLWGQRYIRGECLTDE